MSVIYEWDVEVVSATDTEHLEAGEVIEHMHQASLDDAKKFAAREPETGTKHLIVLVRDDDDRRSWAYLNDDGTLPEFACDADGCEHGKIPQRFHREVAAA